MNERQERQNITTKEGADNEHQNKNEQTARKANKRNK